MCFRTATWSSTAMAAAGPTMLSLLPGPATSARSPAPSLFRPQMVAPSSSTMQMAAKYGSPECADLALCIAAYVVAADVTAHCQERCDSATMVDPRPAGLRMGLRTGCCRVWVCAAPRQGAPASAGGNRLTGCSMLVTSLIIVTGATACLGHDVGAEARSLSRQDHLF